MSELNQELQAAAAKHNIGGYRRHVFLCTGPTCCTPEAGMAAWEVLKNEIKQADLSDVCYRTKVGCLRICYHGPTMVVYPEGTWYHGMTADRVPRFVQEHFVQNQPVKEWVFAENPVGGDQK
jgi:(2Fe-2S) ferredoxin